MIDDMCIIYYTPKSFFRSKLSLIIRNSLFMKARIS